MSIIRRTGLAAAALGALLGLGAAAAAQDVVFLSTQLRPIEEAQKVRDVLLRGGPRTNFVVEDPARLNVRVEAEQRAGTKSFSVIGALHGELSGLTPLKALDNVDDVMARLAGRGIPQAIADLGKLGGQNAVYVPWMQATYIMAANRQALPHLPAGADINALTYEQLGQWAANIQRATGQRRLGFPAGPRGLMARFFQGYLYPSHTGGVVSTFKAAEAEAMWAQFKALWASVNPASTSYDFMQEPLATGEVWIAWDHIARPARRAERQAGRLRDLSGPVRRQGARLHAVVAGLSIPVGAPNRAGAVALIEHLTSPPVQLAHAREVGFFRWSGPICPPTCRPARGSWPRRSRRRPARATRWSRSCPSASARRAASSTRSTWTRSSASCCATRTSGPCWAPRPPCCRR